MEGGSRRRKRILVITPQLPHPPYWGFAIRVRELVRELSKRHDLTLVSFARPEDEDSVRAVRELCDEVHTVAPPWPEGQDRAGRLRSLLDSQPYSFRRATSRAMQALVDDLLRSRSYDLVQVESAQMSGLHLGHSTATILDEHNIEYELLARSLRVERGLPRKVFNLAEYLKVRGAERRAWRRFDGCVVTSDRELPEVSFASPQTQVAVVPNGVDLERFVPQPEVPTAGLVFSGLMRYRPNIDAVVHFVNDILPLIHSRRPEVTFTIVGWGVPDEVRSLLGPRVFATDRVPDVRPYLAGASVVVAPIRIGGGTRLKVLEGLAMSKAMVSTSLGCEGVDVVAGRDLLVADRPQDFADAVLRLLDAGGLRQRLGEAGRRLMESSYGWDSSAARLEQLQESVLASRRRAMRAAPAAVPASRPGTPSRLAEEEP
jgi:glycosyltransferase involved in cell wall biosynthesis